MSGDRKEPWPWQQRAAEEKGRAGQGSKQGAGGGTALKDGKRRGKWSRGWRRVVKWMAIAFATLFVIGLGLFAFAYATTDIPDPNEGFEAQTTYVYYADGKTVLGKFAEQDRTNVDLEDVPEVVQDAVIAAEDRTFETNRGIDPKGILRAAFNNASGGDTQGASTITQQYVKVLYLSQDRTWSRKAKEAILSLKIQREKSKDEILEGYLNTIYFGRGAYGIEAAAQAYFDISSSELDVRQAAVLAAIINSPNGYDPANGKQSRQGLKARYDYVLDGMEEMGTLPAKVTGKAILDKLPPFPEVQQQSQYGGQRGHVLRLVRNELSRLGYSDSEIDTGGLRITTTLSRKAMTAAAQGVAANRPALPGLHVAVASVDPRTGALRGMFAGQDYLQSQLNWAEAGGAPGSTFKPFALAAGLEYGYALDSYFDGSSPQEVAGTEFGNQGEGGGISYGFISLLQATIDSVNTAYVNMANEIGVDNVVDTAVDMGIPRDAPGLDDTLSIVLGSATVSPIDMANAYGTIADGGAAKDVFIVSSVKAPESQDYQHKLRKEQAIPEDVAAETSYALQQVTAVGTGTNANVIGRPIAGKTGTATTDGGNVRSSWFVGYTPQLATAVMYTRGNGNQPLNGFLDTFYGGEYPARTWASVMGAALEGEEILSFPERAYLDATVESYEPYTPPPEPEPEPEPTETAEPSREPEPEPSSEAPATTAPPSSAPPSESAPATESPSPAEPPGGGGARSDASQSPAAGRDEPGP
ncbi:penicillin-binding protein [Nocardioides sp. HDW12B]|uniref:transglycosylase domain-containing protein n=1 Tax=Nocardioides sp. HDW12B TaxID=2714939 RepID=UPI00140A83EE|nr:transglycosylase domain-containing protein [Nocardioides sp. HDW12B]QIK67941.1 penicillin-binding protein [Nocardioides sp. HDW12B]